MTCQRSFEFDAAGGRPAPQQSDSDDHHIPDSVATPKPLSSKQEAKLRSFLDGALEESHEATASASIHPRHYIH